MIDEIFIEHFRGFSSTHITGLKRVNVIVGKNASGKTALLESIFLSAGAAGPQVTLQLRALRQLGNILQIVGEPSAYRSLWEDLFHWFDQDKTVSIKIVGSNADSRSMRVLYEDSPSQLLPFGLDASSSSRPLSTTLMPQVLFEWQRGDDPPIQVRPKIGPRGFEFEGASAEHFPVIMFSPHATDAPDENAKRFSGLSKTGKISSIVRILRAEYPFIRSLSIEYSGTVPTVHASLTHNYGKKIPVALISDGINRLLSIMLGIGTFPKGAILIDQIEDGFYYARMPSIWKALYRLAQLNEAQIFATTHSLECLSALQEAMRGNENDFSLIYAQKENGVCKITTTKGKFFEATIKQGFDPR
ncbi:MAG: AAA family ATPase [Terriglobia bacterium]